MYIDDEIFRENAVINITEKNTKWQKLEYPYLRYAMYI